MNRDQIKGLRNLRDRYLSDHSKLSDIEPGSIHKNLETLTLSELEHVIDFPSFAKSAIVELDISNAELSEDNSPVFDIAIAARLARSTADRLRHLYDAKRRAFMDEMKSGFRLESVMPAVNYKLILDASGIDIKTASVRSLEEYDPFEAATRIKDEILSEFGYHELAKILNEDKEAISLRRLIAEDIEGIDGAPNPVLFDALAERIIDEYVESKYGGRGFVKDGNVQLEIHAPKGNKEHGLLPSELIVLQAGIRPELFTLNESHKASFPNTRGVQHSPFHHKPTTKVAEEIMTFTSSKENKKFNVAAEIYEVSNRYKADFGKVIVSDFTDGLRLKK